MRLYPLLATLLVSCAAPATEDGFSARLADGCRTAADCTSLNDAASDRYQACMADHPGLGACIVERNDKIRASNLADRQRRAEDEARGSAAKAAAGGREEAKQERRAARTDAEARSHEQDCASDRDVRRSHRQERTDFIAKREKLLAWVHAHCVIDDQGRDRIIEVENSDGTITKRHATIGDISQKCDAKPPEPLPPWRNEYAGAPEIPYNEKLRNAECSDEDAASR